jgi:ATP-dependent helicase/nuclease subunit B
MSRQALFTIAPHAPFLDTLVEKVLDGTLTGDWPRETPLWLTDVTIILPTRRASTGLAAAFARARGGSTLLPDIRTLGGEQEDEEPFLPPFDAPDIPTVMAAQHRRLILAVLVECWISRQDPQPFTTPAHTSFASPPSPAEVLMLADSLGSLIDEMAIEGVTAAELRAIPVEDIGAYWQSTLKFLDIALTNWPGILKTHGRVDAATVRNLRLRRQAEAAPLIYGERPVIAAGSTGSIPASAELMMAIARLSRGALVLPGLDTSLTDEAFETLLDAATLPHGNPQYGLARLLQRLKSAPANVEELAPQSSVRTAILRQALKPAVSTGGWANARAEFGDERVHTAMEGVSVLAARTEEEEARAVALAARQGLASGSVGIISPDRNLARRIAAELNRFGIEIDDSAGTPLFQSRAGRLTRQVLAIAASNWSAVDLVALLRNRYAVFGMGRAEISASTDVIEMGLMRGQRPAPGADGLRAMLAANRAPKDGQRFALRLSDNQAIACAALIERIEAAIAPLQTLLDERTFASAAFVSALANSVTAVTEGIENRPPGMAEFDLFVAGVTDQAAPAGPKLITAGLEDALMALMAGISVRAPMPGRTDIVLLGQLEARMHSPTTLILAGVNEGIWPEVADPGPWLSRGMRVAAGLEPPEWRQGLAAHDFEMALGNRQVAIAFAERVGTSPATPSRLVQRLEAFVGGDAANKMRARGALWLTHARALDMAGDPVPATRPLRCPSAKQRPRRLTVTEIETLIRSPYDLYARHVLGLRSLDALGEDPGARERGSIIHDVFGRFIIEGNDPVAPNAAAELDRLADRAFAALDWMPERRDIWRRRFAVAAEAFLAYERGRNTGILARHAEIDGEITLTVAGQDFILRGRADRIDEMTGGQIEIIDFKTGGIPASGEMKTLLAPQLPLEALMVRLGGFARIPPGEAAALTYVKIGAGPEAFAPSAFAMEKGAAPPDAVDDVAIRLARHVEAMLLSDTLPMAPLILPKSVRYRLPYEHLARVAEWSAAGDEVEE